MDVVIPEHPPFTLRARLLTPLRDGETLWLSDGLIEVHNNQIISSDATIHTGYMLQPSLPYE